MNMIPILDGELSVFQWLQVKLLSFDKYWCALIDNCSITAIALIAASLITAFVTWILTKNDSSAEVSVDGQNNDKKAFVRNHLPGNIRQKSDDATHNTLRKRQGIPYCYVINL